jgi:hypothetical protein
MDSKNKGTPKMSKMWSPNQHTNLPRNQRQGLILDYGNTNLELHLAIIERDTAQFRKERLDKLVLELQSHTNLLAEKPQEPKLNPTVKEITFSTLTYGPQQGAKLGAYETATKPTKDNATWIYAYNILKANNATIQNRFQDDGYQHTYWIFDDFSDKIYRQKLKEKK